MNKLSNRTVLRYPAIGLAAAAVMGAIAWGLDAQISLAAFWLPATAGGVIGMLMRILASVFDQSVGHNLFGFALLLATAAFVGQKPLETMFPDVLLSFAVAFLVIVSIDLSWALASELRS